MTRACIFFLLLFHMVSAAGAASVEDYYREADQFLVQKDYARAMDAFQAAVPMESNPFRAWAGMGNCSYYLGEKSKALEYFEKSLALQPNNQALVRFVEKLRAEVAAMEGAYAKGLVFFAAKRYQEAIPCFQETILKNPRNLAAFYDLGYCQYMTGDKPEAALNFGYYGRQKPDSQAQTFASKVRDFLTPNDQQWLDDQWKVGPPFSKPFRFSGWGVRLEPLFQAVSLKDLQDAAQSLRDFGKAQQTSDPSYQLSADVPAFALGMELNPFIQVFEPLEAGLTLDSLFLGELDANFQSDGGSGNGLMDFQIFDGGVDLRAHFLKLQKGKIDFFLDANPCVYSVSMHVVNSTAASWGFVPATGDFSGSGIGGRVKLGVDWKPLPNSILSAFLGYQSAAVSGFKGSAASTPAGSPQPGQLEIERNQGQTTLQFIQDGQPAPVLPPGGSLSPLTVDLSGILLGFDLTVLL